MTDSFVPIRVLVGARDAWPFHIQVLATCDPGAAFLEAWHACRSDARIRALIEAYRLTPGPLCRVSFEHGPLGERLRLDYGGTILGLSVHAGDEILAEHSRRTVPAHALAALADRVRLAGAEAPIPTLTCVTAALR